MPSHPAPRPPSFLSGFWITSLGTFGSRVLGLARDIATAALLGSGPVMDALVVAFRVPNLFRRLFGEGALASSYLPVLTEALERDRAAAWRLASFVLWRLTLWLSALVLIGETICGIWGLLLTSGAEARLLLELLAILLPFLLLGCLAAQVSATLQALGHFRMPALAPTVMNLVWIVGAVWVAPSLVDDQAARSRVLAACIVAAGAAQLAVQWPALVQLGFRFDRRWSEVREPARRIAQAMAPLAAGYAVTQINALVDSLIAWGLAASPQGPQTIWWLGDRIHYPLRSGAAAAVYYGERFYQFPLGMLGLAVATAIYPALARHAARGDRRRVADDLSLGLRLVCFTALPAGVGLMLLAEPLVRLGFERGQFTSADSLRAAGMVFWYGSGVWAYCALPVLTRGYYALGDRFTPVRTSLRAVLLNVTLNLTLVWALAERGLAVATAISAVYQTIWLVIHFSRRHQRLDRAGLIRCVVQTGLAALAMSIAVWLFRALVWPPSAGRALEAALLTAAILLGVFTFLVVAWRLRMEELRLLFQKQPIDGA